MPSAIILVNTPIGMEKDVLESFGGNEDIEEAIAVHGVYDIIVKVKAKTFEKVREVVDRIKRSYPHGILSMVTMWIVENPTI